MVASEGEPAPSFDIATPTEIPTADAVVPALVAPTVAPAGEVANETELPLPSPLEEAFGLESDPVTLSDGYGTTNAAIADAVTTCMTAAGFVYFEPPLETPPPSDFVQVATQTETDSVRENGYGFSFNLQRLLQDEPPPVPAGYVDERTKAMQDAFAELSSEGRDEFRSQRVRCQNKAADEYAYPDDVHLAVVDEIVAVRDAALLQPTAFAAWSSWSRCMSESGYSFENRTAAMEHLNAQFSQLHIDYAQSGPTPEFLASATALQRVEAATTAADVRCATTTGLDQILRQAQIDYEQQWLEDNGDRVSLLLSETTD